jgi:hypothetical protein
MITETRIKTRTNKDIPFFNQANLHPQAMIDGIAVLRSQGKFDRVITYSDDGLTETTVTTHADLDSFSQADTLLSIELDAVCWDYIVNQHGPNGHVANSYVLSGIDHPFTVTITYHFPQNVTTDPTQGLVNDMQTSSDFITRKLSNATVTDSTLVFTYQYDNATDYQTTWVNDMPWVTRLHNLGATRTIKYASV